MILDQYGKPIRAQDSTGSTTRSPRLINLRTGAGGAADRDLGTDYVAHRMERQEAERLYQMSWAAQRMVRIIVDDMFVKGRRWIGDDEQAIQAMEDAEMELQVMDRLADALVAGRLFGTALLIVCNDQSDAFATDLNPEEVKEGSLRNLWVVDRWAASVENWQTDPTMFSYGAPYQYRISGRIFGSPDPSMGESGPTTSQNVLVNASRMLRFDGVKSPLTEGWTTGPWEREWGVSVLTKAVDEILRDAAIHAGVGHLVQEMSVWVQKIQGFKEAIAGRVEENEATAEQIAEETNMLRSIYRTQFMDAEDEAQRLNVPIAGLAPLLNYEAQRLAAIEGIPITRFLGTSATGLNATGEGDARDWRITVQAMQSRMLKRPLKKLDMMVARHAGLEQPPEYEWIPLGDMTDSELAELTAKRMEATVKPYEAGLIDEDEARERLNQDDWYSGPGQLGQWAPSQMSELEMEEERRRKEEKDAQLAAMGGNGNGNGNQPSAE